MLTYRPDIDGLRAIAVLSVLFYHLDESLLSGGFVGVDIFFVISGYLITKLIAKEKRESGGFRYGQFYLRRVRRLFPALAATLTLSLIGAAWLLSPAHLIEFGESAAASVLSLSNIYFWSTVNYFDSESQLKPLLHTWSLSVEEQFYLIWPALLVALLSVRKTWFVPIFILLMGIASLWLNIALFGNQAEITEWFGREGNQSTFSAQATAFYWLPFRVFEFAIGAILVFLPQLENNKPRFVAEFAFLLGLAVIIHTFITLDDQAPFPSTAALWPCIGAALMIVAGPQHRLAWLVSNKLAVGIGLISYSLYLVHWPIIVFFKYRNYSDPNLVEQGLIVLTSTALAWAFYKFVEQPFRKPRPKTSTGGNKPFLTGAALIASALIAVNLHASWSGGWLQRYPADVVAQLSYKQGDYSEYFWRSFFRLEKGFEENGKPKVLVIGDSMAADFVNVLVEGGHEHNFDLATIPIGDNCKMAFPLTEEQYRSLYGGAAEVCRKQFQKIENNTELLRQADSIVLASYWREDFWHNYVKLTSNHLRSLTDARILVSGLKDQVSNGIWFLSKNAFSPGIHLLRTPASPSILHVNNLLRRGQPGYKYFDLIDRFCDSEGCQRVTEDGFVIIFDQSHFSERGAEFVGQRVADTDWFKLLLSPAPTQNENTNSRPAPQQ